MLICALGILKKDSKILFLRRQNTAFSNGYYGLIGGTIEKDESVADALIREVYEEINININKENLKFVHCLSYKNEKHEDVLALVFDIIDWQGQPFNKEPHKCIDLAWFSFNELPADLTSLNRQVIEMVHNSISYSENGW